jgi:methionyl-tRNA formyltransferase
MTDLPYGRGGSPLQNLILNGLRKTTLTAFRMTQELDAGPVYMKRPMTLDGNAEEIYIRSSYLSAWMIGEIITIQPSPKQQEGDVVKFKRRTPEESEIKESKSLDGLYDFIRMLDAGGYPKAFINHKGCRYEFSNAGLYNNRIEANVKITKEK